MRDFFRPYSFNPHRNPFYPAGTPAQTVLAAVWQKRADGSGWALWISWQTPTTKQTRVVCMTDPDGETF